MGTFFRVLLPCAAFAAGYRLTDEWFRRNMIPFPFENFGVAVGLGCFFWMLGLVVFIQTLWRKRRNS